MTTQNRNRFSVVFSAQKFKEAGNIFLMTFYKLLSACIIVNGHARVKMTFINHQLKCDLESATETCSLLWHLPVAFYSKNLRKKRNTIMNRKNFKMD